MSTTGFTPRDYSLRAQDLIPPDDEDLDGRDDAWADAAKRMRALDTDEVLLAVCERLSASPVLRRLIEELQAHPFEPGERRHLDAWDNILLGDAFAVVADAVMRECAGERQ